MRQILLSSTRQLEFWSGLQGIGAGIAAALDRNFIGQIIALSYKQIFILSAFVFLTQIVAVLINSLKIRHYTNIVSAIIGFMITYMIFSSPTGNLLGIGCYGFLALEAFFCAFMTNYELQRIHKK